MSQHLDVVSKECDVKMQHSYKSTWLKQLRVWMLFLFCRCRRRGLNLINRPIDYPQGEYRKPKWKGLKIGLSAFLIITVNNFPTSCRGEAATYLSASSWKGEEVCNERRHSKALLCVRPDWLETTQKTPCNTTIAFCSVCIFIFIFIFYPFWGITLAFTRLQNDFWQ